jgi:hypothetical protein
MEGVRNMNFKRKILGALCTAVLAGNAMNAGAQPLFENNTPVGFSPSDSTTGADFVVDTDVTVRVDLNEAANATNPVIGNFQKIESAVPILTTPGTAAYMSQAIAVDNSGIIHRAWIQQRGTVGIIVGATTPVYGVLYAKSIDGGKTFLDTLSVSGSLRFDMLSTTVTTANGTFSTVD